jgi:probable F420-dependent oxidoreductase
MRFAIAMPQFHRDGEFDPTAFRSYLERVEELGFHSAWTQENVLGSAPEFGPIETMSYAAACTRRLRLGCAVLVSTLHSPAHLAKSISTLDQLSGGRIEIGFGTGGGSRQFSAFGVDRRRFVSRFTEGLALMKALWTEDRVTFDGEFWQLKDAPMEPKPAQKPYPPIWLGASAPAALRRAPALASGFFGAGAAPTAKFAEQVRVLREALAHAGRPPGEFPVAKRVYVALDADSGRARQRINAELELLYGRRSPDIEAAAVAGTVADCVSELRKVAAAGAELILLSPMFDHAEQLELLAARVIPELG